ncbi:hypothetical protein [Kallotenue papyrolyticum]|uniref:hypothetical protein n=1 Tax=Kallotenue papyrolyticum TaxID=1325125 RepID=UPI0004785518|nr:hypothetical protein [Kallotenue papyrolyticum]
MSANLLPTMRTCRRIGLGLGLLLLLLAGCSPEDGRPRGAGLGSGADVRNYPAATPIPHSKVFSAQGQP